MWNRVCPLCFARVPRAVVLADSYDLVCPTCHTSLELSRMTRVSASVFGLLLASLVAQIFRSQHFAAHWAVTLVACVLAFALASAATVFLVADLVVRSTSPSSTFPHSWQ